jgi:replicative DNA helicase Mcm
MERGFLGYTIALALVVALVSVHAMQTTHNENIIASRVAMLEQQTISIAKANIRATLISESTVLAAANPKLGRFDPYSDIPKQINMPPSLLNRFDLIFVVLDEPDEVRDKEIAKTILTNDMEMKKPKI